MYFARKGIAVECVQTVNGFGFTNRFSASRCDLEAPYEAAARQLRIRHKSSAPMLPDTMGRWSAVIERIKSVSMKGKLPTHQNLRNWRSMRPLHWVAPRDVLSSCPVQYV